MSEYTRVDHPAIYPQHCVLCRSQTGPQVDTGREGVAADSVHPDRLYVCELCVTLCARAFGLVKGERMTELLKAGKLLDAARTDITDRDGRIEQQIAELAARARKIEALEELLQQGRDKERTQRAQLESINEQSRQLLQVT